jgi:hypothetical protein
VKRTGNCSSNSATNLSTSRFETPSSDGKWIWSKRGARLASSDLPAMLRSDVVHITEGEKDAEQSSAGDSPR